MNDINNLEDLTRVAEGATPGEASERLREAWMRVQQAKASGEPSIEAIWDAINAIPAALYHLDQMPEFEADAAAEAQIAEIRELRGALERAEGLLQNVRDTIGEGIHAGLRKGVDGKGSAAAWRAISDMTDGGWGEAIQFFTEGVGLDAYLRARQVLADGGEK